MSSRIFSYCLPSIGESTHDTCYVVSLLSVNILVAWFFSLRLTYLFDAQIPSLSELRKMNKLWLPRLLNDTGPLVNLYRCYILPVPQKGSWIPQSSLLCRPLVISCLEANITFLEIGGREEPDHVVFSIALKVLIFLLKIFIYLKGGLRQRPIFHPLVHDALTSLPSQNGGTSQDWASPKPGVRNSTPVSHTRAWTPTLGPSLAAFLTSTLLGSWVRHRAAKT